MVKSDLAAGFFKKRRTDFFFDLLDNLCQEGLGDSQLVGRAPSRLSDKNSEDLSVPY